MVIAGSTRVPKPKITTYSLRLDQPDSGDYYRDIAGFTDVWQEAAIQESAGLIAGFCDYRWEHDLPDRSDGEYAFELLALGVLLGEHGADIARMTGFTNGILKGLVSMQKRWPRSETAIKRVRGWTGASTLQKGQGDGPNSRALAPGLVST